MALPAGPGPDPCASEAGFATERSRSMSRIDSPSPGFNDAIEFGDEALAEGYFSRGARIFQR